MYKPPISILEHTIQEFSDQIEKNIENGVFKAIMNVGIVVDKEELIKALNYDRGQYNKGYADGVKEFEKRVDDSLCKKIGPSKRLYWKISADIKNTVKEMVGDDNA